MNSPSIFTDSFFLMSLHVLYYLPLKYTHRMKKIFCQPKNTN